MTSRRPAAKPPVRTTPAPDPQDHRVRVGRKRRARTEARIIEAALGVFAERGTQAPVIDDFVRAAGVARGTFYNYYRSTDELLAATQKWLEDDLIMAINARMEPITDPVERVATGTALWLAHAQADPAWCAFAARVRHHAPLVEQSLTADLRAGRRSGAFSFTSVPAARDLVVGTLQEAMRRMTEGPVPRAYLAEVRRLVLLGLGVDRRSIARLASQRRCDRENRLREGTGAPPAVRPHAIRWDVPPLDTGACDRPAPPPAVGLARRTARPARGRDVRHL
jgi:AcrR family transcriptional regulator